MATSAVQIILGSESDAGIVRDSGMADILRGCGVDFACDAYSAHRNPRELAEFCASRLAGDTRVFIAAAGMAAALPGAVAGLVAPSGFVLGVPLDRDGVDSCLHMPPGVPVATMGVGKPGLRNAAIAAVQILAMFDEAGTRLFVQWHEGTAKHPKRDIEL